jgi:hypothetical protein
MYSYIPLRLHPTLTKNDLSLQYSERIQLNPLPATSRGRLPNGRTQVQESTATSSGGQSKMQPVIRSQQSVLAFSILSGRYQAIHQSE